jgi:hypothetical protein
MTDRQCSTCSFWQPILEPAQGASKGECRRYAPQPPTSGRRVVWPFTAGTDWCGEHRQADTEGAR